MMPPGGIQSSLQQSASSGAKGGTQAGSFTGDGFRVNRGVSWVQVAVVSAVVFGGLYLWKKR